MASTLGQDILLNGSYRRWMVETFDGHEMRDDELPDNSGQNGTFIHSSSQDFDDPLEPCIGMEFESAEDAREYYEMYGRRIGFTIRNNRTRRSLKDKSIIGREYVCSKEGFRQEKCGSKGSRVTQLQPKTREGCNAMLRIAAKEGGKWIIYGFVKEHNHKLSPSKMPPRRSHRIAFSEDEKDLKIRELSTKLHHEKKKSAAYQEQLGIVLKYVEEHTHRLSLKIQAVTNSLRELESEDQECSESG